MDERVKLTHYQVLLIIAMLINFYLFFSWKLTLKHKKFPIKLMTYIFIGNLSQMFVYILLQKTNRNLLL